MGYVNCNSIFCWSRKFVALYKKKYKALYATLLWTHLSMNKDHRSQEPPRPSLSIHVQHAQDLEEANAPATHTTSAPSSVCLFHSNRAFLFFYFTAKKKQEAKAHRGNSCHTWWQMWQTLGRWTRRRAQWLRRWPQSNLGDAEKNATQYTQIITKKIK